MKAARIIALCLVIAFLATACGSRLDQKAIVEAQKTATASPLALAGLPTPTADQAQPTSPSSTPPALPKGSRLEIYLTGLTKGETADGWTQYSVILAMHNPDSTSVMLTSRPLSDILDHRPPCDFLRWAGASVETIEGQAYSAPVETLPSVTIPPQLTLSALSEWGSNVTDVAVTLRVPELQRPSRLTIFAESGEKAVRESFVIELAAAPSAPSSLEPPSLPVFPAVLQISDHVEISVAAYASGVQEAAELLKLVVRAHNTDVSADQYLNARLFLFADDQSPQYQVVLTSPLPFQLFYQMGPNQTIDVPLGPILLNSAQASGQHLYLSVLNDNVDAVYALPPIQ